MVVDIPSTYNTIIGKEIDGGSVDLAHDKIQGHVGRHEDVRYTMTTS